MRLSVIAKNIIANRLYDVGVTDTKEVNEYLNNIIINSAIFTDNNTMFSFIVNNYGKLLIA